MNFFVPFSNGTAFRSQNALHSKSSNIPGRKIRQISFNGLGHDPTDDDGVSPYSSPVGSFSANGYGLYDMAGNMWEWCWDWWGSGYYGTSPASDPRGPSSGALRVFRGGSWGRARGLLPHGVPLLLQPVELVLRFRVPSSPQFSPPVGASTRRRQKLWRARRNGIAREGRPPQ